MIDINSCKKKLIASILCANTIFLTMPVNVWASDITGITPTGNTYNIEAAKVSGSTGFRQYTNFDLSQGDIANLKFKNNYSKFVNLVDNQVKINGIVNTMKDNSFYNGHAIFVSPNGMVIGASGLLNVGSLSVLTPSASSYSGFKDSYTYNDLSSYEFGGDEYKKLIQDSQGNIVVNGKILAREEVNLYGSDIKIGDGTNRAGIIAGYTGNETFDDLSSAENTFNSLVSNNITNADSFALQNGKLQIVANKESGMYDAGGNVTAKVDIKNADIGANEINVSSTAKVERQDRIDLATAKVNVENSTLTGDTVSLTALSTQKKDIDSASIIDDGQWIATAVTDLFDGDTPSVASLWGVAGKAEADVTVKNTTINALKAQAATLPDGSDNPQKDLSVLIHAEASSETSENANFLTPTLIDFITSDEAKIGEYFSTEVYNGFEGARSSATVNVENSTVNAKTDNAKNVEISTEASSSLDANNRLLAMFLPIGMYGTGTETVSKAIVTASTVNVTNGDVDVTAISTNENSILITNDSTFSIKLEDGFIAMLLNNTVKTDTLAEIINSTVNTKNLTVLATNLADSSTEVTMEAIAGTKTEGEESHGNSAVSGVAIMNRSNNKVTALIKDCDIKTEEDTLVLAQSLNITENAADGSIDDWMVQSPKTFDKKFSDFLKKTQRKYFNVSIFEKIRGQNIVIAGEDENPYFEAGGAVVLNNTNNLTTAKIENSKVEAGDVTVQANTIDLLSNAATSDTQGEGQYGLSAAVIYNEQNNTTNAIIDNSEVEADNVTVDATTELPMNVGKLTFGMKFPFKIKGFDGLYVGGKFASEANGKWDTSLEYPKADSSAPGFEMTGIAEQNIRNSYNDLKPKFRLSGFFNNLAQTNSIGGNASASGAVVINFVNTNTTASIQNDSVITLNSEENENSGNNQTSQTPSGAVTVNAVNSVIGYNGLGLFDILIKQINYKIPGQTDWEYEPTVDGGKFGLGANFAWDEYTNNATAKIDNSTVNAENGSINVDSATEQSYLNVVMTGAKSEAAGIDGSIHVQKLKGDTNAVISNVKGDKSITAKDISVNAGKAHIKTTAGSVKRDDDTNQIKWKVQDSEAQGDAKYVREAKDEITNIIVQGAWSSQIEEIDNTVQENSAGVAVGASVNITDMDRTVKATINNAIVEATNDLTVNADTYNQKIDVEVAGAFSGSVKQKEMENVQQNANNAQDDENIFGNLFDGEDEYMRNPVGNYLDQLQGQFSMSLAGAVDITTDSTKAEASIVNSEITAGNNLKVNSNRESLNIVVNGAVGKSKKVGAGAAVNVYEQEGSVKSYIDGSTVEFTGNTPKLSVDANNKNWILDIAIGAGAAVNTAAQNKGFQAAVGGSASANTIKPTIEAYINNSTIGMAENKTGNIATDINAKSEIDITNIAGGGSLVFGAQSGVSAGAALNYNNIKNTITSYIKDSTLNDIGKLTMLSDADNNLSDWAIAGAIVAGTDGGAFNFAGGVNIDYIHDTISSKVINSTISANDDVEVKANSKTDNLAVAGTFDITMAQSGVGVNGDVVVDVFRNDITSEIDKNSSILKAKDVKVAATSTEKANVIPVGVSVAASEQFLMAAANVGVNIIDNTVKSYASGHIGTGENSSAVNSLTVAAYDETTLYSRGGTVALASADAIANIAGFVNVDKIDKTVEAKIQDAEIKATGDVTALASSINSLGGTKDENNEYTRDDVTTDAYKEKMLKKNENGDYDDLKLGNDFKNWNMFFDVSAGATVSAAGAGIGKVIENTITAEVYNSKIEADKLYVLSKDYSVKNIVAGSIGASGTAAAGLQAIYTRDNSTTNALITNGSELTIADAIEMLASNRKDSYEILVAGSGAGTGVINANVVLNNIKDKTVAKIDNGSTEKEIKAGTVKITADEDINSSHIIVSAGGAKGLALTVSPTINNYDMTTETVINNAKIKDAAIDMDSASKLGTLDIAVGVAGAGQGLSGVGNAIKNVYTNNVKSYIDNSVIDTAKSIAIDADSVIDSNNWLGSVAFAGQGVDLIVNLILNDVNSTVEAGIKNSDIQKAGDITINSNKDKKDELNNRAAVVGFAGQGVSASVNLIKNVYGNTVSSYVDNTSSNEINSLTVNSNSDRWLDNLNVGVGFAGQGASLLANAIDNELNSTTHSYVDAKSKTLKVTNALNVESKDRAAGVNTTAMINGAAEAAALGANISLFYADNLAKSELKTAEDGEINAGSLAMNSEITNAIRNADFDLSFGLAAIPVDVQLIELGKRTGTYSDAEQKSKIEFFVNTAKGMEPEILKTPTTASNNIKTGAISTVNGNIKTENNADINAKSQLKGIDSDGNIVDKLELNNIKVSVSGAGINIAIRDVQNSSNTLAEIAGGTVESEQGNVGIKAESTGDVKIKNTEVNVEIAHATGGSAIYNNSSETLAQIKDSTVNANDINVVANSSSKSDIYAKHVIVAGAGVVTVDLAEATDTNKVSALVTSSENGKTNINASGKLTLHSTASSDLSAVKDSYPIQLVNLVDVSRNKADVNTIARAVIENVNGEINADNLDIITDYDKMRVFSEANVVAAGIIDIASYTDTGSFMKADFKSGIDSPLALTLNVTDTTNIVTSRDNRTGSEAVGIVSESKAPSISASVVGLYTGAFANAENNATSTTVLNVKDHTSKNLNIDQYLKTSAIASGDSTKVSGAGVSAIAADSKDISTMAFNIAGANTITQNAVINATHNSKISSSLDGFNFGLVFAGARLRIDSELNSNTTGNIGGEFNASTANINLNTTRESVMSKSSGSGGFINVSNPEAANKLTGSSVLNVKNINSDSNESINNWTISNKSENTFDVTSSNGSGGFINVAVDKLELTFDTSTNTNIENSNINSTGKVKFEVENKGIIKDEATGTGGGFVAVSTNDVSNTYKSGAKLTVKDTNMQVKDLELKTSSDLRTKNDDYVKYAGTAGGFVAVNDMHLKNTLTQTSEIDIQNSNLEATKDAKIGALTSSSFKQKIESNGYGFVAVPRAYSTLEVTNTNKISLDSNSKIKANDELDISFDSNNNLGVHTVSIVKNFEGKPSAYSTIDYTVNNTLNNNGSLEAGNLVDINFMNNSINNLNQYAHSECYAWIASTNEGGELKRTVNNAINVNSNADITSGKDVDISYSAGKNNVSSLISWYTESWPIGFPIGDSGSSTNDKPSNNYSLKDDGKIVAGQGNSKYMKINRDGTIDKTTLKGFYDDDYSVSDEEVIPGSVIKQRTLDSITIEKANIQESLTEITQTIEEMQAAIDSIESKKAAVQTELDEIEGYIADGYELKELKADNTGNSDFNTIIQDDIKALLIKTNDSETDKITEDQYNTIMTDYSAKIADITSQNTDIFEHNSKPENVDNQLPYIDAPAILEFLETQDYGLTDEQKSTITNGYNSVNSNISVSASGSFTTYQNASGKYVAVSNPTGTGLDQSCDEITGLNTELENLTNQIQPYSDKLASNTETKGILEANITSLDAEYNEVLNTPDSQYEERQGSYEIVFNDINPKSAHINVDGAYNPNITGSGIFSVATSGLKIDNYSTRSLLFNRINTESATGSGLIIGGKNHAIFADKNQAVSGWEPYYYVNNMTTNFDSLPTSGVHYKNGGDGITGITINNYYDINHPFASTFDIPNPTESSYIGFGGIINSTSLNVWNESGSIYIYNNGINTNQLNLYATNGEIGTLIHNNDSSAKFTLNSGDNIFAARGIAIWADDIDIKGNIKSGYSDRSITITDEMLQEENLIVDDTSGEKNLINLGGSTISPYLNDGITNGNIKAIYKDGQIYLYNIPHNDDDNIISLWEANENLTGSVTGNLTYANGYQNITIDNQTDKQLNVNNIINNYFEGEVYKFTSFSGDIDMSNANIVEKTNDYAKTDITSNGKLSINGVIENNLDSKWQKQPMADGILNITANNGLDIKQQTKNGNVVESIFTGGLADITVNNGDTNILGNITNRGNVEIYNYGNGKIDINGNIAEIEDGTGTNGFATDADGYVLIQNDGAGKLTVNGTITNTKGNIDILGTGTGETELTNAITAEIGDITVVSKGLTATEDSQITAEKGDISITNNDSALDLEGSISAQEGNIDIQNNGTSAVVAGFITDEKGDLTVINTNGDMTISSEIYHNFINQDSEGMISIINNPDGGKLDIQAAIQTQGAGKTEQDAITGEEYTTAVLIDNRSTTEGMNISNGVTARVGDIIIKNASENLTVAGLISNYEQGNINISNTGKDLQTSANAEIINKKGDVTISNTGEGKTLIGGSINNQEGNTSLSGRGTILEVSGTVDNNGGNTAITNTNGQLRVVGDVTNKGGNTLITNSGSFTEITSAIANEAGSIHISNSNGHLNITNTAQITNTTDNADHSITIANGGDNLSIAGIVKSLNKGDVEITNTGKIASIEGTVFANEGDIDITNDNAGALNITGDITDYNGNVSITNNSEDGANIGGTLTDEKGNITISNNKGDLSITSEILHNYVNRDAQGLIQITNAEDAGAVNINSPIATYGEGQTDNDKTIAVIIDNQSATNGMALASSISARVGDIIIKNASEKFETTAEISNTENGGIYITNNGDEGSDIAGKIITKQGDIEVVNNSGDDLVRAEIINQSGHTYISNDGGVLTYTGSITNDDGEVLIANKENAKQAQIGGTVTNKKGNTTVSNAGTNLTFSGTIDNQDGSVNILGTNTADTAFVRIVGDITNKNGDIVVNNLGSFTEITSTIDNEAGNISVSNKKGHLNITDTAVINNTTDNENHKIEIVNESDNLNIRGKVNSKNKGNIKVDNKGGIANIDGTVFAEDGNIQIQNTNDGALNIAGHVTDNKGNIQITNSSNDGTSITGTVLAKEGNTTVYNTAGGVDISGYVVDNKGDLKVINNGEDGTDISGTVLAKEGNTTVYNTAGGVDISGYVVDNKGDLKVINNGEDGTNISGTVLTKEGNTTIYNTAGGVDISGNVTDNKGNLDISNTSDELTTISGTVNAKEGNASVYTNGGLTLTDTGYIVNDKGTLNITNNGGDGIDIQGNVLAKEGNATVYNTVGGVDISGNVVDDKGNLDISNTSDELTTISGTVNAKDGNASVYTNGGLTLTDTGYIVNDKGTLNITNNGGDGIDIQGNVLAKEGNATVYNTVGGVDISGNVVDDKGDLKVINNGEDGTDISGTVLAKEGNATVYNTAGGVDISGYVVDDKGDLDITNTGDGGSVISGIVLAKEGNIDILNEAGDFTVSGTVKDEIGNIDITNNGGVAEISGTVLAQNGDIDIKNSNDGALNISGLVMNEDGKIDITNNSNDGTNITGEVTNVKDDTTIKNNAGDIIIADGAEVTNIESGNINAENRGGKFTIAGLLKHFGIGNIDVNNLGNDELAITETGIVEAENGNIDIKNSNNGALNIAGLVQNNDGNIDVRNDAVGGTTISGSVVNVKGDTTITNNVDDIEITETGKVTNTESGDIKTENRGGKFTIAGLLKHFGIGNISTKNAGKDELNVTQTGTLAATEGNIEVRNANAGGINVEGFVGSDKGITDIYNTSDDGIKLASTGKINNKDGEIKIANSGKAGIDVQGSIKTEKQDIVIANNNSDLRIGEYESDNDNYINAVTDNVIIRQTNGNILNNITDTDTVNKNQNADIGNPDHAYKTLIATGNNLVIGVKDGDIGSTTNSNPGYGIEASTRDYTESINVNVKGTVTAQAVNKDKTDERLVNIRAKDSDLKVENVKADGNVMLTAADWKQADTRPTPKNDKEYFKGYSVINSAQGDKSPVLARNISVIASDMIGTEAKPFAVTQDTKNAPNSSVSFEGENDVNILVRSNSKEPVKINQLISKHGNIGLILEDDGVIKEITAGDHLHILQKAKNLTIYDLGMTDSKEGYDFDDILYPHDDLKIGGEGEDAVVPQSVAIEVLDSKGGNKADSTLKIYSASVKGRNNGKGAYDKDGRQIADISLMADNIYANSAQAPDSTVETKANPNGYKQTDKTYSDSVFGANPSSTIEAKGINAYGNGTALSFDITGVKKEFVDKNAPNATRTNYNTVTPKNNVPDKFKNDNATKGKGYSSNNVVISVNDNVNTNRGVNINSIYADDAYINTKDTKLTVRDGNITNYAEFRNRDKIASVDNDYRRLVDPADIQLYTDKTGSFYLKLKENINMETTAPTVYNNPYKLVNGYHSAWNFVNRGRKEAENQIENIGLKDELQKKYEEEGKRISMRFDTTNDDELQSNVEIYDISTTGALIGNDGNLKKGDEIVVNIQFEDVDVNVKAKVVNVDDDKAGIEFIRLPKEVASKILYRYMQQANSMKLNLTSSL